MKYIIFFIVIFSSLAESNQYKLKHVEEKKVITLVEAINKAKSRNINFKKSGLEYIQAHSKTWLKTSRLFPNLSLVSNFHLGEASDPNRAALILNIPVVDLKALMLSKAGYEELKAAKLYLEHDYDYLVHEISIFYIKALKSQLIKKLAKEENDKFNNYYTRIQRLAKSGSIRALDETKASYQSHKSSSDYYLKERDYQNDVAKLGLEIGEHEDFDVALFVINSPTLNLAPEILTAMARSTAEIKALQKNISSSHYALLSETMAFVPTLRASAEGGYDLGHGQRKFSSEIMLKLELPVFSGGSSLAQLKNLRAQRSINELNLRQKEEKKVVSVAGSLEQIRALTRANQSSVLALQSAKFATQSTERLFAQQLMTTEDYIDANLQLFSAQNDLIESELELVKNQLELLFIVGKIQEIIY
jgi:outer membrane protein TolC